MKFKIGDSARLIYIRAGQSERWKVGTIVTILEVVGGIDISASTNEVFPFDYVVSTNALNNSASLVGEVVEAQLEPIVDDITTWESIESITGWSPIKEKEKA